MDPLSSTPSPSASPSPSPKTLSTSVTHKNKGEGSKATQQSESISISQTGQEINQYTKIMADLPDIRQKRITEIQAALKKGTYSVSAEDLADKLISEISNQPSDPSSAPT